MKSLRPIFFSGFLIIVSYSGFAQTGKTIQILKENEQSCLDNGVNMLNCTKIFYVQIDSLLNVVYLQLRSSLNLKQQQQLKKEQKEWLSKRDIYFQKTLNSFKKKNPKRSPYGSAIGAQDDAMVMLDDNSEFVIERIMTILGLLKR